MRVVAGQASIPLQCVAIHKHPQASHKQALKKHSRTAQLPARPRGTQQCIQHTQGVTQPHTARLAVTCSAHVDSAVGHAHEPATPRPHFGPLFPQFHRSKHDSHITQLAVPALFSLLLDPVMSLIDCAIIGRLGADSLAATGASISIFSLAGLLVSFLSYVTVPAVAEASTQGDSAEVSRVIATGVWIAVVAGIFVTAFIIAVGPLILRSMRLEASVVEKAGGYVWARALGSVGYLLVLVGSGSFRGIQVRQTSKIGSVTLRQLCCSTSVCLAISWPLRHLQMGCYVRRLTRVTSLLLFSQPVSVPNIRVLTAEQHVLPASLPMPNACAYHCEETMLYYCCLSAVMLRKTSPALSLTWRYAYHSRLHLLLFMICKHD